MHIADYHIGFASSPYVLRPFSEPELECHRASFERRHRMRLFNKLVLLVRVRVEQAYGLLKGRFPGLKILRTPANIDDAYQTVEALMSVHNFCINCNDQPKSISWFDTRDAEVEDAVAFEREHMNINNVGEDEGEDAETRSLKEQSYRMREEIFNHLFPPS